MKSLRQRLQEQGLLESYLKQHPYNLAAKYFPGIAVEPLENYMDVRGWDWELGSRSTGEHGSFPIPRPVIHPTSPFLMPLTHPISPLSILLSQSH